MSTCDVIDTADWQGASVDTIGSGGFGVLGAEIAATGDAGAGYAYNDLQFPTDTSKEICGRITTWPAVGTLYAYEDTSFTYSRPSDGTDSFQYQLYVDGIAVGVPQTVALTVGSQSASAPGATLTGAGSIAAGTATGSAAGSAPGATLVGTSAIIAGSATGERNAAAAGVALVGTSSIQAGAATGGGSAHASAAGATLIGVASIISGIASNGSFARAPAGSGYAPRLQSNSIRPAQIQGYTR